MPLPAALLARLAKRGIVDEKSEVESKKVPSNKSKPGKNIKKECRLYCREDRMIFSIIFTVLELSYLEADGFNLENKKNGMQFRPPRATQFQF